VLELRDIHFSFDREVLAGITLEVRAGEVVALLGPNGAGKSTLLGIASGTLKPTEGSALLKGRSVSNFARREIAREVALVSQSGEVRFPLTSLEYVLAGRYARVRALGFDSKADFDVAHESLRVTDADQFAQRKFNELSSGERQRVVLARALAQEPKLLLLDEPTANVDIAHQVSLLELLRRLTRSHQLGALLVTHEINLAADFADRVALIKNGRLLACGTPLEVMRPELLSECFETPLLVDKHPQTGNPRVSPMLDSHL
jgi:iron complex transport system ATP-binding protein